MLRRLKGRPAAILLKTSCAFLAAVVEQLNPNIFPDGVCAVEARSIDRLDLDDAVPPAAAHAQDMPGYFREAPVLNGYAGSNAPARMESQYASGRSSAGPSAGAGASAGRLGLAASFSICFGVGMRQLTGLSHALD
jgi:hypothetical protein